MYLHCVPKILILYPRVSLSDSHHVRLPVKFVGLHRVLAMVSVSGQYQHFLMISELVKYSVQASTRTDSVVSVLYLLLKWVSYSPVEMLFQLFAKCDYTLWGVSMYRYWYLYLWIHLIAVLGTWCISKIVEGYFKCKPALNLSHSSFVLTIKCEYCLSANHK